MTYKTRTKATVTRRAGTGTTDKPNGSWMVELYGDKGEHLGYFEFDDVGTYWIRRI